MSARIAIALCNPSKQVLCSPTDVHFAETLKVLHKTQRIESNLYSERNEPLARRRNIRGAQ